MAKDHVIHLIPLVKIDFPKPKMTYLSNFGQTVPIVSYIWYLEGPRENIIVDAGIAPERLLGRGYKVEPMQSLDQGLSKVGLGVGDIDFVILTHTHHDHIALAHKFPKAKFIIQRAEIEFDRNPHPFIAETRPADFMELIGGLDFEVVEGDTEISAGIRVLLTPGHSAGAQSVAIKTAQGTAIITGFCCIQENFEPPAELRERISFYTPGIHLNVPQAYESVARVRELADLIVPLHEAELVHKATIP